MCLFSLMANLGHAFPETGDADPADIAEALGALRGDRRACPGRVLGHGPDRGA